MTHSAVDPRLSHPASFRPPGGAAAGTLGAQFCNSEEAS